MKTTLNTKQSIRFFLALMCCLFLAQANFAQTAPITLTFSGRDAVSGNIVPLQSVMVSNVTHGGDTTVYGDAPTLILQESSGIFEINQGQNASFTLEPNFPNPFAGKTTVTVLLQNRQHLNILLYDQQGAISASLEQEFSRGTQRFEVAVPQNRIYLFSVSDGKASETLKLFSTAGNTCLIAYTGPDENAVLKTGTETTTFAFQPGDMLEYTVNAAGYYEYTTFDNPTENTDYVFDLQANTTELPPTVSTASITNITATSATCGGNVSDQGSAAVTARGVCWSTSPSPTIANSHTTDGTGIGTFTSTITGLTESTTYYARAYATNQYGTAYGNEVSFTTTALEPLYVCDSAITYSSEWGTEKVVFTRNAVGQELKVLYKVLNTSYGVWVNNYQYLYIYDASGNKLSESIQTWNTNIGSWVNYYQYLYTYDASGNTLSYTYQEWDTNIGTWVNYSKRMYTYDASGNRLSSTYQEWNINIGSWGNIYQYLYTYDNSGNWLSYTYQEWNTNIGGWINSEQLLYTYDASGNMLSYTYQYWNTNIGTWVSDYQYLYTYDAYRNRLSVTYQQWNTNIGSWVNYVKRIYTYDASRNRLSETVQEWNTNIGSWVNYFKSIYTYDASGNKLSETGQEWNTNIGTWVNYSKSIYSYDASGNQLSYTYQEWNTNIGTWVNNYQYLNTYNASGNRLSRTNQDWNTNIGTWVNDWQYLITYDASGNQLSYTSQDWSTSYGTWINEWKHEYTYDYATNKITWMYYLWSGAWMSEYFEDYVDIVLNDNWLWYGYYCNKVEVWWDEYPSNAISKMTLQNLPTVFSPSDFSNTNHPHPVHLEEHTQPDGKNLSAMDERKERPGMHNIEKPAFGQTERPLPGHKPISEYDRFKHE